MLTIDMDSEERSGLVTQFLQVSGLTDRSIAEAALERAHWDLAIAVHRFFGTFYGRLRNYYYCFFLYAKLSLCFYLT